MGIAFCHFSIYFTLRQYEFFSEKLELEKKKKNFQISSFIEKGCEMFVIWNDFNFWRENSYLLEREKEKDFNKVHLLFNCTHLPLFISFILFLHLFHT